MLGLCPEWLTCRRFSVYPLEHKGRLPFPAKKQVRCSLNALMCRRIKNKPQPRKVLIPNILGSMMKDLQSWFKISIHTLSQGTLRTIWSSANVIHTPPKAQVFHFFRSKHFCIARGNGTWLNIRGELIPFQAINNDLRGYSAEWVETTKLRETIQDKYRRIPSFGAG